MIFRFMFAYTFAAATIYLLYLGISAIKRHDYPWGYLLLLTAPIPGMLTLAMWQNWL